MPLETIQKNPLSPADMPPPVHEVITNMNLKHVSHNLAASLEKHAIPYHATSYDAQFNETIVHAIHNNYLRIESTKHGKCIIIQGRPIFHKTSLFESHQKQMLPAMNIEPVHLWNEFYSTLFSIFFEWNSFWNRNFKFPENLTRKSLVLSSRKSLHSKNHVHS